MAQANGGMAKNHGWTRGRLPTKVNSLTLRLQLAVSCRLLIIVRRAGRFDSEYHYETKAPCHPHSTNAPRGLGWGREV